MTQRIALITGASRGIGAAAADLLTANGWKLSLGLRDPDTQRLDLKDAHRHHFDAEAGNEAEWVEAARRDLGRIDAVICCAGVTVPGNVIDVIDIDDATLDRMWEVNVKSPRRLVKAAWPDLTACGSGRVVIVSSLSGKRVKSAGSAPYAMTKHAATALLHGIRQTGWDKGIRGTAICPSFVNTDMARAVTDFPVEKMTQPEEVARLVNLAVDLPNTASVPEMTINCNLEEIY